MVVITAVVVIFVLVLIFAYASIRILREYERGVGVSSLFGVTTLRTLPPYGRKPRQSRRPRWPRPSRRRPSPCLALLSHNPRQRVSSDIVLL
jgi:hypothetical protein